MIISVEKLRELLPSTTKLSDEEVRARLVSLESLIRKYTNNNFQARNFRATGNIRNGQLEFNAKLFKAGDTFQISNSLYNEGVYVYGEEQELYDEDGVLITKVVYPPDVVQGVVNLFKWDIENRGKVGVKSESLSRYSVTYYDLESGSTVGFPNGLVAFLKPYIRAKF